MGGYTSKDTCKDIEFPEFGGKNGVYVETAQTPVERCEEKCGVPQLKILPDGCEWSEDEFRCRIKDERIRNLDTNCWGWNREDPDGGDEWGLYYPLVREGCAKAEKCEIIKETGYCTQA